MGDKNVLVSSHKVQLPIEHWHIPGTKPGELKFLWLQFASSFLKSYTSLLFCPIDPGFQNQTQLLANQVSSNNQGSRPASLIPGYPVVSFQPLIEHLRNVVPGWETKPGNYMKHRFVHLKTTTKEPATPIWLRAKGSKVRVLLINGLSSETLLLNKQYFKSLRLVAIMQK